MEKLVYTNSLGEIIEFSDDSPFILYKIDGTAGTELTSYTTKAPGQQGKSHMGSVMEERILPIEIILLANSQEEMLKRRSELCRIMNPLIAGGKLTYTTEIGTKEIFVEIDSLPIFKEDSPIAPNDRQLECLLQFMAPTPFWLDPEFQRVEIALWKGAFEFPLIVEKDGPGHLMGYREPSLIVNVFNPGDVPCGMEIEFKAMATVTNPLLFNINTREFIQINQNLIAGDVLKVNTAYANKRVELIRKGVKTLATNFIDLDSDFLQLNLGDNLFRYDAQEGLDNLEVSIVYKSHYLGV